jgi:putative ABC transport system permease protein
MRQLGIESLLLSLLGGLLGLFAGWSASRALTALAEGAIDLGPLSDAGLDHRVLAFTLILSCLTALLFGFAPAWQASRIDLQSSVKSHGKGAIGGRGQDRMRSVLVVGEVALAVVLLVGAGLLLRTLWNITAVKLGFQTENAFTMRTIVFGSPSERARLTEAILERIESLPRVAAAGTIQFLPLSGHTNQGPFHFVGRSLPADPLTMESDVSTVSRGYFEAVGMQLLRGRDFGREERIDGPRVALVNQAFVKKYSPEQDPIGRVILGDWADPKPTEIVGVVNDIRHNAITAEPRPTIFFAQSQVPGYITYFVVRTTADPASLAAAIRREVRNVDPRQPLTDVQPLAQYVSAALARPRLYANFIGAFASLAVFLAAIGLYGLMAYLVSQRTHEIGLRMALGARPRDVLSSTILQGARLVAAGLALGIAAAMGLSQLVSSLLYGVRPIDPATYLAAGALLLAVGALAAFVPARRAAAVDPIVALRYQ